MIQQLEAELEDERALREVLELSCTEEHANVERLVALLEDKTETIMQLRGENERLRDALSSGKKQEQAREHEIGEAALSLQMLEAAFQQQHQLRLAAAASFESESASIITGLIEGLDSTRVLLSQAAKETSAVTQREEMQRSRLAQMVRSSVSLGAKQQSALQVQDAPEMLACREELASVLRDNQQLKTDNEGLHLKLASQLALSLQVRSRVEDVACDVKQARLRVQLEAKAAAADRRHVQNLCSQVHALEERALEAVETAHPLSETIDEGAGVQESEAELVKCQLQALEAQLHDARFQVCVSHATIHMFQVETSMLKAELPMIRGTAGASKCAP